MLKTVNQSCEFNASIHNYRASQGVERLTDLIAEQGCGEEFFKRNFVTKGMSQLLREGFSRLAGQSSDGVFLLQQAMGGGKTHTMVALGLLAKYPHLRESILDSDVYANTKDLGEVRIAAFNGRNDPENFLWGELGDQLGIYEMQKYWKDGPKKIGQDDWKRMLSGKPTLIMLDELPPYLLGAKTTTVGKGSLLDLTIYNLSNLMSASLEMRDCMIVITNLDAAYGEESKQISKALELLGNEAKRQSRNITPVELSSDEIYQIIKRKLVDKLPSQDDIREVAEAYAKEVKKAERGGLVRQASIEQLTEQVMVTYPFHPSFKHIVAMFKENPDFRQTRGLMQFAARLIKSAVERDADDVYLIGAQHLDLSIDEVSSEIRSIAKDLHPAIAHDIYDGGNAIAEQVDAELGNDSGTQVAKMLLVSSLSRSINARLGLTEQELFEFLVSPNQKLEDLSKALQSFRERAWYAHKEDERIFIRETENLSRRIERIAKDVPANKIEDAFINHMKGALQPVSKKAYQQLLVTPKMDDIDLRGDRVLIVLKPDGNLPPEVLNNFFQYVDDKNNFLVLSGTDSLMAGAVDDRLRELYATEQVLSGLKSGDALYEEAQSRLNDIKNRFRSAVSHGYNKLYYPNADHNGSSSLVGATIDSGLTIGNKNEAELQIEDIISGIRCDNKLMLDVEDNWIAAWTMAETDLWPSSQKRTPWRDILMRARQKVEWMWLPFGRKGLERMREAAIAQGRWRQGSDGYIEKGPFAKEKASANVVLTENDFVNKTSVLQITPINAGNSPVIHVSESPDVDTSSPIVDDPECFTTKAGTLYFLVVDQEGVHESAEPTRWVAKLEMKHQPETIGTQRFVRLACSHAADISYTLDGSNPKEGTLYKSPIEIDNHATTIYFYAKSGAAEMRGQFAIPANGDTRVVVDKSKKAKLDENKKASLDSTEKSYEFINAFKGNDETTFKGVRVIIGDGENATNIRFGQREVTVSAIEKAIEGIRSALGNADENVIIKIQSGAGFSSGLEMEKFCEIAGIELKQGDFSQEGI